MQGGCMRVGLWQKQRDVVWSVEDQSALKERVGAPPSSGRTSFISRRMCEKIFKAPLRSFLIAKDVSNEKRVAGRTGNGMNRRISLSGATVSLGSTAARAYRGSYDFRKGFLVKELEKNLSALELVGSSCFNVLSTASSSKKTL
jgi:hypothetical protein